MIDDGQKTKTELPKLSWFPNTKNKTPLIFAAGVLLILAANLLFKKINLRVEPIGAWNEKTLLVIRAKKAADFWQGVAEVLQTMDPEFNTAIDRIKLKTGVSPLDLAKELLPEPIELVISEKNGFEKTDKLKYDFILVTKSSGKGVENIPAADATARDFISWFMPTNHYITLNDGSKVKTQIADPKEVRLQKEVFNNEDIIYISEAELPFEYTRSHSGAWLIFGTSKISIEDVISKHNQTMPFEKLSRNCASPNGTVDVFFHPGVFNLTNKANVLLLGSPIRGLLKLFNHNRTKIKANGLSITWNSCSY